MFLIPDSTLENLTCDNCKKYLSVSPVKVYPNKHIHCGRCSEENDGGVKSLYENIVERGLFKCINRYDGCNEVLPYTQVSSHEENCKSGLYSCPNCQLVPKMSPLVLINHFKEHHKDCILKRCSFSINVNRLNIENKNYLYNNENFLFLIYVSLNSDYIVLNAFHIGKPELLREITQRFILSASDGTLEIRHVTEKRPCCIYEDKDFYDGFIIDLKIKECNLDVEIDLDTRKAQKLLLLRLPHSSSRVYKSEYSNLRDSADKSSNEMYLSREFKKMWSSQFTLHLSGSSLVSVNNDKLIKYCCFCENKFYLFSIMQSVYKCTQCSSGCDTFICSKCYLFGITKCDNGKNYEYAPIETTALKYVKYYCRWNCSETNFSWDLLKHEYNCVFQKDFLCPVKNCQWLGTLCEMPEHVESHGSITFYEGHSFPLNMIITKKFCTKNEVVIPVLNHFVNVKWKKVNNKYVFSLYMKHRHNKMPVGVLGINGSIDIITDSFVVDVKDKDCPSLLIILRDI